MFHSLVHMLGRRLMSELAFRTSADKADGLPLIAEEALVHAKSDSFDCYIIHFYISDRDNVVNCCVPYEIWRYLQKGWRGLLCHQGGLFYSFEHNKELICEDTIPTLTFTQP